LRMVNLQCILEIISKPIWKPFTEGAFNKRCY
jgi:hypothetical protein